RRAMRAGTRRLLLLRTPSQVSFLRQSLSREQLLTLAVTQYGTVGSLVADATEAAIDALLDWAGAPAWTAAAFEAVATKMRPQLNKAVRDVAVAAEQAPRAPSIMPPSVLPGRPSPTCWPTCAPSSAPRWRPASSPEPGRRRCPTSPV